MKKDKNKGRPIISMSKNERDELWDSLYEKEEGIILEFDVNSNTGKVKSIKDGTIYKIDSSEMIKTKIKLRPGDKIIFAPFEDFNGNNIARAIKFIK